MSDDTERRMAGREAHEGRGRPPSAGSSTLVRVFVLPAARTRRGDLRAGGRGPVTATTRSAPIMARRLRRSRVIDRACDSVTIDTASADVRLRDAGSTDRFDTVRRAPRRAMAPDSPRTTAELRRQGR